MNASSHDFPGGKIDVRHEDEWAILHVLSGSAETTTSLRPAEAAALAMSLSPALRERLTQQAEMMEQWAPDIFGEKNEHGQVHFGRAMMESFAHSLRAIAEGRDPDDLDEAMAKLTPEQETAAEIARNEVVEVFIRKLSWFPDTPDLHKTLVAGNLRNFWAWLGRR